MPAKPVQWPTCKAQREYKRDDAGELLPERVWRCLKCGALYRVSARHQKSLWTKAQRRAEQGREPTPLVPRFHAYLVDLVERDGKRLAVAKPAGQVHHIRVEEHCGASEGLDLEQTDPARGVVREISVQEDPRKTGTIDIQRSEEGETINVAGQRRTERDPGDKVRDENEYAAAFAAALSEQEGRTFEVKPKEAEDYEFHDVMLLDSETDARGRRKEVGVQITFIGREIGELQRAATYDKPTSAKQIAADALKGMQKKSNVGKMTRARTFLLLTTPYPIRASLHEKIRAAVEAGKFHSGYKQTWIAPLRGKPFKIQ